MAPARRVQGYLSALGINFRLLPHPATKTLAEAAAAAGVDAQQMVRAVMLEDERGLLMAVLPAHHIIDFDALSKQLGRSLKPAALARLANAFPDSEPGSIPPLALPYGLPAVIDEGVAQLPRVCFEPGSHGELVEMDGTLFMQLHKLSRRLVFSRAADSLVEQDPNKFIGANGLAGVQALLPVTDLQQRISQLSTLPPLTHTTQQLLHMRSDARVTIAEVSDVVATDPSLAGQVMRYARSAFYGYRGKVETLYDAITRVLGLDLVLHLALGLSASRALNGPADGPLGMRAFWRHSVYAAGLAQALNTLLPTSMRCKPGLIYLAALLHDIGYAVLGDLFQAEFYLLNKSVEANPSIPIPLLEKRVLGIGHTQIGSWLLRGWGMPEEVVIAAQEHHDEYYNGPHAVFANLILLTDHMLKGHVASDAATAEPPPVILTALGLEYDDVAAVTAKVMEESRAGLEEMANNLTSRKPVAESTEA